MSSTEIFGLRVDNRVLMTLGLVTIGLIWYGIVHTPPIEQHQPIGDRGLPPGAFPWPKGDEGELFPGEQRPPLGEPDPKPN
jgi:hypothetical protein